VETESYDVIAANCAGRARGAFDKLVELALVFGRLPSKNSRVIPLFELPQGLVLLSRS